MPLVVACAAGVVVSRWGGDASAGAAAAHFLVAVAGGLQGSSLVRARDVLLYGWLLLLCGCLALSG